MRKRRAVLFTDISQALESVPDRLERLSLLKKKRKEKKRKICKLTTHANTKISTNNSWI